MSLNLPIIRLKDYDNSKSYIQDDDGHSVESKNFFDKKVNIKFKEIKESSTAKVDLNKKGWIKKILHNIFRKKFENSILAVIDTGNKDNLGVISKLENLDFSKEEYILLKIIELAEKDFSLRKQIGYTDSEIERIEKLKEELFEIGVDNIDLILPIYHIRKSVLNQFNIAYKEMKKNYYCSDCSKYGSTLKMVRVLSENK